MAKTVIEHSDKKSQIIKKVMQGMGVNIDAEKKISPEAYREKLMQVSVWTDDDIKVIEDGGSAIKFKPTEW
jgi:hypothetical protein